MPQELEESLHAASASAGQMSSKLDPVSVFGAVSAMVMSGDLLSGCLGAFASFFMVFEISLEIEAQTKGKK